MSLCIDPAEPAQVRPLMQMPQRVFSCSSPGAGRSESSLQSGGWHAAAIRTGADARIAPWAYELPARPSHSARGCAEWWIPDSGHRFWPGPWSCGWWRPAHCPSAVGTELARARASRTVRSTPALVLTPPSWISRCATGASPAVPGCGNRSPGPSWSSHHVRARPGTCRWPSAHSVPWPLRAGIGAWAWSLPGAFAPASLLSGRWTAPVVEPQQMRHRSIAEGWVLLDHGLDRRHQSILQLWRSLD